MRISFDPAKRAVTLAARGLDFGRCEEVFAAANYTAEDRRADYGETRYVTVGRLDGRMVVVAWTSREGGRRIISLRHANERERTRYEHLLG